MYGRNCGMSTTADYNKIVPPPKMQKCRNAEMKKQTYNICLFFQIFIIIFIFIRFQGIGGSELFSTHKSHLPLISRIILAELGVR